MELAPAFRRPSPFDSGSKLHALHTLRAVRRRLRRARSAFTLAEVLAALAFMAIVIPVAIQGLRVAGQAGEVAIRKSQAARIADKIINQSMVTTNWSTSQQTGQTIEGTTQFQWTLRNEAWKENPLRLISAEVSFMAQDKKISVRLSTLVDSTPPGAQPMGMTKSE